MRKLMCFILMLIVSIQLATLAKSSELTVASWNIANLHHETGVPLRVGSIPRRDKDFLRLQTIFESLNADIIALQEVGSLAALKRVASSTNYHLVISSRYSLGDENRPPEERDIYTAVAISKSRFPTLPNVGTVDAFSIKHVALNREGDEQIIRPTRAAIEIEFEHDGQKSVLLNLHLKSFCHNFPLKEVEDQNFFTEHPFGSRFDCRTLKAQLSILENWIEVKHMLGYRVILAGDFNRQLNMIYNNPKRFEDFWGELNDGSPNNLKLVKGPVGKDVQCWPNHNNHSDEHIDFLIADSLLIDAHPSTVFRKIGLGFDNDIEYADVNKQRLSDHCPVVMQLN